MHAILPAPVSARLRVVVSAGDAPGLPLLAARLSAIDSWCVQEAEGRVADAVDASDPDLVVYEVCPCGEGLEGFLDDLATARTATPLLVLGVLPERVIGVVRDRRGNRAWGYLDRSASPSQIAAAAHAVRLGLHVVQGDPCPPVAERFPEPIANDTLSGREAQILRLLADGLPNKQIAARLSISAHTVKFHVARILEKLGAESRAEAVAEGVRRRHLRL